MYIQPFFSTGALSFLLEMCGVRVVRFLRATHKAVDLRLLCDHLGQHRGTTLGIVDHGMIGEVFPFDEPVPKKV